MSDRRKSWIVLGYLPTKEVVFTQAMAHNAVEAGEEAMLAFQEDGHKDVEIKYIGYGKLVGENQYVANQHME